MSIFNIKIPDFLGNTLESAYELFKYSKIYINLSRNCINYFYQYYSGKILTFDLKWYNSGELHRTLTHKEGCKYGFGSSCSCNFTRKEKIIGFEKLLKYEHNNNIHPIWNIWELETKDYNNYSQWLPRELTEMNLQLYRGTFQVNPDTYIY